METIQNIYFVAEIHHHPTCRSNTGQPILQGQTIQSTIKIQEDLDKLNQWSSDWQLRFNAPNGAGASQEKVLETTHVEKDLGVHVDNHLKFHNHTNTAVAKSNKILGITKISFANLH